MTSLNTDYLTPKYNKKNSPNQNDLESFKSKQSIFYTRESSAIPYRKEYLQPLVRGTSLM